MCAAAALALLVATSTPPSQYASLSAQDAAAATPNLQHAPLQQRRLMDDEGIYYLAAITGRAHYLG